MIRPILKSHAPLFEFSLRASDPLIAIAVGVVTYRIYLGEPFPPERYVLFLLVATLSIVLLFPLFRLYEPQRGASLADELRQLLLAWALLGAVVIGLIFATQSGLAFSRVWVGLWLLGSFVATTGLRISVRLVLRLLRKRGRNLRHVA